MLEDRGEAERLKKRRGSRWHSAFVCNCTYSTAIKFLNRIMAAYPKSSSSSEGLLIGRLKERMAADVLKHNSYIVETYLTLCGATIVNTGTSGPQRGRVGRLSQSSGIETLRSV